jgi:hypothetical protein
MTGRSGGWIYPPKTFTGHRIAESARATSLIPWGQRFSNCHDSCDVSGQALDEGEQYYHCSGTITA